MKQLFLLVFMLPIIAKAQKVLYDKTDPFSNERTVNIGNAILSNTLQSGVSAKLSDTARVFYISFLMQAVPGLIKETVAPSLNECLLKAANGETFFGKWFGEASMPIGPKVYNSSTFIFSEDDFKKISVTDITDLKINGMLYAPDRKNKAKIGRLCKMLLDRLLSMPNL